MWNPREPMRRKMRVVLVKCGVFVGKNDFDGIACLDGCSLWVILLFLDLKP